MSLDWIIGLLAIACGILLIASFVRRLEKKALNEYRQRLRGK